MRHLHLKGGQQPKRLAFSTQKQAPLTRALKHVLHAVAQASSMTGLNGTLHVRAGVKCQQYATRCVLLHPAASRSCWEGSRDSLLAAQGHGAPAAARADCAGSPEDARPAAGTRLHPAPSPLRSTSKLQVAHQLS